jgi:hypothetical protein
MIFMKIWDKTKEFCRKHKTAVISSAVGVGSFIVGWVVKRNVDLRLVNDALDVIDKDADRDLCMLENPPFLVTNEEVESFEEEQKELREKYGQDYAILEEAVKNLTEPENGKLWMIENGRVALIDGIKYDKEAEES